MGEYEGYWKRVNGERFFIVIRDGYLFRRVLLRDGKYEALDNTIVSSIVFKPTAGTLESQLMELIDAHVGTKDRHDEIVDRACEKMEEVYSDDW